MLTCNFLTCKFWRMRPASGVWQVMRLARSRKLRKKPFGQKVGGQRCCWDDFALRPEVRILAGLFRTLPVMPTADPRPRLYRWTTSELPNYSSGTIIVTFQGFWLLKERKRTPRVLILSHNGRIKQASVLSCTQMLWITNSWRAWNGFPKSASPKNLKE